MRAQSGNVLVYVLIAVVLLAALSYAVTRGSRSGSVEIISEERARFSALELIDYTSLLDQTISFLQARGCRDEEISFDNGFSSTDYSNSNAPSDEICHVFSLAGGGVNYNDTYDQIFTGSYIISGSEPDLIVDIRVGLQTCQQINDLLGINAGTGEPPIDKLSAGVSFQGDYTLASTASSNQRIVNGIYREHGAGCRTNSGTGSSAVFKYHTTLISR